MINASIARCIAKLSGDGNVYLGKSGKNAYLRYSNTCPILREEFKKDMCLIFSNIVLTEGMTNSGTEFVQSHKKEVVLFFLKFLDSYKSGDIVIPSVIKKASRRVKTEYVRAFYDDEGSAKLRISKLQEWKRNITLSSNSEKIIKQIKSLLENEFKIEFNKIYRDVHKIGRISFSLDITGKRNFGLFKKFIGFHHPKKRQMLNLILDSYDNTFARNPMGFLRLKSKI